MKKWDIGLAAFFIVFAVSIFVSTNEYAVNSGYDPGAAFWPRLLAVILVLLSVIMVIQTMIGGGRSAEQTQPVDFKAPRMKRVYIMIGVFAGFTVLLVYLGFIIASLLFIPSVMFLLGERKALNIILTSLLLTGSVYFLFTVLLRITLPQPFFM